MLSNRNKWLSYYGCYFLKEFIHHINRDRYQFLPSRYRVFNELLSMRVGGPNAFDTRWATGLT